MTFAGQNSERNRLDHQLERVVGGGRDLTPTETHMGALLLSEEIVRTSTITLLRSKEFYTKCNALTFGCGCGCGCLTEDTTGNPIHLIEHFLQVWRITILSISKFLTNTI